MQERRNKLLTVSLILLSAMTIAAGWLLRNESNNEVHKRLFKVEDLRLVERITLESPQGKVDLTFNGSYWRVNETYRADAQMISVLFATLQQAEPKRPVGTGTNDSVFNQLKANGVHVTLYSKEGIEKQFVAGGNRTKTQAYFADMQGSTYLMTIPGYRVYVSGILELDENGFRDKYVFGFNWRNFKSLSAQFPKSPASNFEVAMGKEYFTVLGMQEADTAKVNTFLDDVSLLTVQSFLPERLADSLEQVQPEMVISIEDVANRKYSLSIFRPAHGDKVLALVGEDAAYFEPRKIQPVIKSRAFFAKK